MDGFLEKDLTPTAISNNLPTCFIGQKVFHYHSLPSTMDAARNEAKAGATEGTVIIADQQTAGKGRLKRPWLSPDGSIALSIILYPEIIYLPFLIMLSALAVVHSIEKVTGLKPQIKWPNDVLIKGKKVCGILIETDVQQNRVKYAIVGIGINVNVRVAEAPEIRETATSLSDELGHDVSRLGLVRQLLVAIERLYLTMPASEPIYNEWRDRLVTLGKKVRAISGDTVLEGTAESVTTEGSLLLRLADGSLTKIIASDVSLRDVT